MPLHGTRASLTPDCERGQKFLKLGARLGLLRDTLLTDEEREITDAHHAGGGSSIIELRIQNR